MKELREFSSLWVLVIVSPAAVSVEAKSIWPVVSPPACLLKNAALNVAAFAI